MIACTLFTMSPAPFVAAPTRMALGDIRAWCTRAHLCVRCYIRFAHPRGGAYYGGRSANLCQRHTYQGDCATCAGCLGALSDAVLDAVPAHATRLLTSIQHDGRYKITAALPPAAAHVRERSLWQALRGTYPTANRPHALREAFKLALTDRLSGIDMRYTADAPLFIDVALTHRTSDRECIPLVANRIESRGRKCSRTAVSTAAVARALRTLDDDAFAKLVTIPPPPLQSPVHVRVDVSVATIALAGEYRKLSRVVSQTPWHVDSDPESETKNTRFATSVEQVVTAGLSPIFAAEKATFSAGGREDVDVRMLGSGRPFLVELFNPKIIPTLVDATMLRNALAASARASSAVEVANLRVVEKTHAEQIKKCEGERRKRYRCVVWTADSFTEAALRRALEPRGGFLLHQKTPLRVLHRRTLAVRERQVHRAHVHRVLAPQFFVLDVDAAAGTYIKEFVHGDNGRTTPNVASILGCTADILQLDVLSVGTTGP